MHFFKQNSDIESVFEDDLNELDNQQTDHGNSPDNVDSSPSDSIIVNSQVSHYFYLVIEFKTGILLFRNIILFF